MDKNSFLQSKLLRSNISLFAIVAMVIGFFLSRAVLSMSMMLFGINALVGISPRRWLNQKWWLIGMSWVLLMAISWFWSSNTEYWTSRLEVKLPIMLLPLAFAFTPAFSYKQQKIFTITLCSVLLFGVGYSLYFLLTNTAFYVEGYNYSKVMPTLPKNDHIVFSLALVSAAVWGIYFHPFIRERWLKWFTTLSVIIFAVFLHVLAARTGLVGLYVFFAAWTVYLACRRKTRVLGITLIASFVLMAYLAANYIPTLKHRIAHTNYTFVMFRQGNLSGDYSDMGRYMSYHIAVKLMKERPWTGVGAGNILDTMKKGYDRWYPQVKDEQRLIPHNQFLTVGVAVGLPGLLLFILWVFYPLARIRKNRAGFFFLAMWLVLMVPLMVEPVLEIQFGVFVYLFFLLWQYHAMKKEVTG